MAAVALRILILEDVPMDAELVEYELTRARIPFVTRWVDSREGYVAALREFQPDLILSDYSVPGFDGMAALSLAREHAPAVPFVIVTGSVNEETAVGCMKAGATDYLLKSNLARIGPAIEGALARSRLRAEQLHAEAALERSEANLRAIFNNSLQCFVLVDRDGSIKAFNRTADLWAERILGRRLVEGEPISGFIPQATEAFHLALRGEAVVTEQAITDIEGREHWFETTSAPVVDDEGNVIGVCLNARDVSERLQAEKALRQSEARYRDLFDNASDLVCMTTQDGIFRYVNKAWHERLGYTDEDLHRLRFIDVVHSDSRDLYEAIVHRLAVGDTLDHVELVLLTSAGASITIDGNLSCTLDEGNNPAVRGIYRDITERKRVEEQLRRAERMQSAGRLAGGVAHEVNNMMTGVIGFSHFLMKSLAPDDPRRAEVQEIIKAGTRAADVTKQLLAFTRQQILRPETLEINALLTRMERMLRRSLGEEHQLELRLSPEAGQIRADGAQFEQVLINLLLNARDALGDGGRVTIATALANLDDAYAQRHPDVSIPPGPYVLLSVSDNGSGMDRIVQSRIFEPFFTTKPTGHGTGLGLSTVYGIVKQSGGFVWVYSEVGHGTTFKIYLPRATESSGQVDDRLSGGVVKGGTETILVVEDEDMVRSLACRGLRTLGYTVLEAANGLQAIHCINEGGRSIDLVISDVVMPEMGGRELGQRLSLLDPTLPVLYMSGYTGEDVVRRGLLDPDAAFQQKPFTTEGLGRKVREMLDQRAAARREKSLSADASG
jgi:two-component system, cell cycle sensor histidine kinase and response regulator CckA